jgi:hypothetical protein
MNANSKSCSKVSFEEKLSIAHVINSLEIRITGKKKKE